MSNSTITADPTAFTRDQAEILSTRRTEPQWLRERRLAAQQIFAETPMPTTEPEEWRYTAIAEMLELEPLRFADEAKPVADIAELPTGLRALAAGTGKSAGRIAQVDASVVLRELGDELQGQSVLFTSLDRAARDHAELLERHLGSVVTADISKFAALNGAFWSGGTLLYVPAGVKVDLPLRSFHWITEAGTAAFGRTLLIAGDGAEVTLVEEFASDDFDAQTLSVSAAEIIAEGSARVHYVAVQRFGAGVVHMPTDRVVAGRDARVTSLYLSLGADVNRADVQCTLQQPGAHVDLLGLYIADGTQHVDNETLQNHVSPHASSNLLFKGALRDRGRSVFRGLIRVHPKAQRTDAYQTNRNLLLSPDARADSLPNLEIAADDVRCSHAATVGQLDEEEIFYLLSRGIPKDVAMRLVVFGFFGEVLNQLELPEVKQELVRAIEHKLWDREESE